LVFICAGTIGLITTLLAFRTRSYRMLSTSYTATQTKVQETTA